MREVICHQQERSGQVQTTRIVSPWLRREEAAIYCNMSPAYFDRLSGQVCCRVCGRVKLYHAADLDRLLIRERQDAANPGG
jgi:hypothetical protein